MASDFLPYSPPRMLFNGHLETMYPSLFRRVDAPAYKRERIETPDNDFLDLDWMRHTSERLLADSEPALVIISHGLEGDTHRGYVRGMARAFFNAGTDVLAWNFRSCSGEMNRQTIFYHSGASYDLKSVIEHAVAMNKWRRIFLVGFSLGGNMTLKYLGEHAGSLPGELKKAAVFSVPMDLVTGCQKISTPANRIYAQRFLQKLKMKVKIKAQLQSGIDASGIDSIKTLLDFDNRYTAPLHGFKDAIDYYYRNSANRFVSNITLPTLIVNAKNDPFLTPECLPEEMLRDHSFVRLETPERGGHVGFTLFKSNGLYWSELRALDFIQP